MEDHKTTKFVVAFVCPPALDIIMLSRQLEVSTNIKMCYTDYHNDRVCFLVSANRDRIDICENIVKFVLGDNIKIIRFVGVYQQESCEALLQDYGRRRHEETTTISHQSKTN
jgi:hypothetical protein